MGAIVVLSQWHGDGDFFLHLDKWHIRHEKTFFGKFTSETMRHGGSLMKCTLP